MPGPNTRAATDVAGSRAEKADIAATAKLANHRDDPAVKALGKLGDLGDQPPLFTLGVGVLGFGLMRRNGRAIDAGLRVLAAEALATALKSFVKNRVARTRPNKMLRDGGYRAEADTSDDKEEQSFPSGHTAGAVAVAGVLASVYPHAAVPVYGAAAVIAGVQPLKGAHFLTDVAAGAAIGGASAFAVNAAARLIR